MIFSLLKLCSLYSYFNIAVPILLWYSKMYSNINLIAKAFTWNMPVLSTVSMCNDVRINYINYISSFGCKLLFISKDFFSVSINQKRVWPKVLIISFIMKLLWVPRESDYTKVPQLLQQDGDTLSRANPSSLPSSHLTCNPFFFWAPPPSPLQFSNKQRRPFYAVSFYAFGALFIASRTAARDRRFRCDWWQTCQLVVAPPKQSQTWSWPLLEKKIKPAQSRIHLFRLLFKKFSQPALENPVPFHELYAQFRSKWFILIICIFKTFTACLMNFILYSLKVLTAFWPESNKKKKKKCLDFNNGYIFSISVIHTF